MRTNRCQMTSADRVLILFQTISYLLPSLTLIRTDSFSGWSNYYEFTDRISFHDVSFGAADHHNDLSLEGDDQHRALLHHLSHCQLQTNEPSSVNRAQCSSFATESLWNTYINVINVKDFGLEKQPESFGLLDGVGQLAVCLRTQQKKCCTSFGLYELFG